MVATIHKNRPVRIIHFGLKMRESDPVKLIATPTIQIGNLVGKIISMVGDRE
jgi:hypothetical protein